MSTMQTQLSASQTRATNTGLVPQAPRSLDSRQLFITIPHCGRTHLKTRLFDFHLFIFHGKQTSHQLLLATTCKPRCLRRVHFGCYKTSSLVNRTTPSTSRSEFLVVIVLKACVKQEHQQKNIIERPCRVNSVPEPSPESFQYGRFAFLRWGFAFLRGVLTLKN